MNSITVAWKPPKIKESIHSPIICYLVECVPVSHDVPVLHETRVSTEGDSVTFKQLFPHEFYSITIKCKSLAGWSAGSKPLLQQTNASSLSLLYYVTIPFKLSLVAGSGTRPSATGRDSENIHQWNVDKMGGA